MALPEASGVPRRRIGATNIALGGSERSLAAALLQLPRLCSAMAATRALNVTAEFKSYSDSMVQRAAPWVAGGYAVLLIKFARPMFCAALKGVSRSAEHRGWPCSPAPYCRCSLLAATLAVRRWHPPDRLPAHTSSSERHAVARRWSPVLRASDAELEPPQAVEPSDIPMLVWATAFA